MSKHNPSLQNKFSGFTKCGTTDLFKYFTMHPLIERGTNKELHWWDNMRCDPNKNMGTFVKQFNKGTKKLTTNLLKNGKCLIKHCYVNNMLT